MKLHVLLYRALAFAGALFVLAACSTTTLEAPTPNLTNQPAAGFGKIEPGSEEDFILNVGRRTYFAQGSAELDSTAKVTLDNQIAWLQKYPRWYVKFQGFADDPGTDAQMVELSRRRAEAVMNYIVNGGIDRNRVWAKGYGKERVVRECADTACKVQNRRVISNLREEKDGSA